VTLTLTLALTLTPTLTRCATACEPSPLKRITYRACPVHTSDKSKFVGAKKTLESHSFGHGRSVLDFEEGLNTREVKGAAPPGEDGDYIKVEIGLQTFHFIMRTI